MDIKGASAIVTGGASGIGAASARRLANRGAPSVAAILRSMLALQQATKDGR